MMLQGHRQGMNSGVLTASHGLPNFLAHSTQLTGTEHTQLGDLGTDQADHWHPPDDIKKNICVVNLAIHTVIVQRNDVVQLGNRDVHICMVTGVQ